MKMNIKKMVISALLMAISIIIPLVFGSTLRIYIPPFSATLASHVPMFLSMFLGPFEAAVVGIGSAIGFLFAFPDPVIAARAAMHIIVGFVGGKLILKNVSFTKTIFITAPLHGFLEALVVMPFGFDLYKALIVVGIGGVLHHIVDGLITLPLVASINKATGNLLYNNNNKRKDMAA